MKSKFKRLLKVRKSKPISHELSGYVNAYDYHIGSVAKVGESYGVLMSDITQARNENGVPFLRCCQR